MVLMFSMLTKITNQEAETIPEFFDSREKWPNCVSKIYDQGTCGACYAISVATAFSMRFCIKNNLNKIINFSPQHLVNCLSGCQGEFPDVAWNYLYENGITTDECISYKNSESSCNTICDSNKNKFKKYFSGETKFLEDEISIKKEIMKNGPVTSMMYLYEDYYNYKSGIYSHSVGEDILGFHAIVIVGWGVENNIKYWIIQDSYGNSRGENGYMRIKIGDESGAGATGFCDEKEGNYIDNNENDYENEDNNEKNNNNSSSYISLKELFINNYKLLIFILLFLI